MFRGLSQKWTMRLQMAVKARFIKGVPLFCKVDSRCLEALVLKLKVMISIPSEALITQGKMGQEMYFVNRGTVQVVVSQLQKGNMCHVKLWQLGQGEYFGEIALVPSSSLPLHHSHCCASVCLYLHSFFFYHLPCLSPFSLV